MWKNLSPKLRAATAAILVLAGSGCATTEYVYVEPAPLPRPTRPELPQVSAPDLMCLSDETYSALVERDAKLKAYAEELEAIIGATRNE